MQAVLSCRPQNGALRALLASDGLGPYTPSEYMGPFGSGAALSVGTQSRV